VCDAVEALPLGPTTEEAAPRAGKGQRVLKLKQFDGEPNLS
jgi:hypothetical protein